ncbi:MAG: WD40 repeat domain-containing protein [Planctomycetes bacterium]|nr:WD40 repeat domain-containing protein [Planctomycetota bacterium]
MPHTPRLLISRRWIGWTLFAAFLGLLGWALYAVLPPQPRWTVGTDHHLYNFLKDGSGVITTSIHSDGPKAALYSVETGELRGAALAEHRMVWRSSHYHNGTLLDTGGRKLVYGHLENSKEWTVIWPALPMPIAEFSPEGDLVTLQGPKEVWIIEAATGLMLDQHTADYELGRTLIFTPEYVVTNLTKDQGLRLWNRKTLQAEVRPVNGRPRFASKNGQYLIMEAPKGCFMLWDLPNFKEGTHLGTFESYLGVAFSSQGVMAVWDRDENKPCHLELWDLATRTRIARIAIPPACGSWGVFSPTGDLFALDGPGLAVYGVSQGKILWSVQGEKNSHLEFSSNSRFLVWYIMSKKLALFDAETGEPYRTFQPSVDGPPVSRVDVGNLYAFGSNYAVMMEEMSGEAGWLEKLLLLLPGGIFPEGWTRVTVIDLNKGEETCRFDLPNGQQGHCAIITEDGQSLVTLRDGISPWLLQCWDVPPRRSWAWIIGVPAGLGVIVVGWRMWGNRKGALRTAGDAVRV